MLRIYLVFGIGVYYTLFKSKQWCIYLVWAWWGNCFWISLPWHCLKCALDRLPIFRRLELVGRVSSIDLKRHFVTPRGRLNMWDFPVVASFSFVDAGKWILLCKDLEVVGPCFTYFSFYWFHYWLFNRR